MTLDPSRSTRRTVLSGGAAIALAGTAKRVAAQTPEIIDIHARVTSKDPTRYPPHPFGGVASDWAKDRPETIEALTAEMAVAGVSKAVLVQVSTFYGTDNAYIVDAVARDPKRFTGVCTVDVAAPDAVKLLEGLTGHGMTGLRIFTGQDNTQALADPKSFPAWEYCEAKGLPICLEISPQDMTNLHELLRRFPRAKVILENAARPKVDDGPPYAGAKSLFELAAFPNVYLKIIPRTFALSRTGKSTPEAFFGTLASTFGARRIAFGSNIPSDAGPLTKLVAEAKACLSALPAADQAMIFSGTAKRLYPTLA